MAKWTKQRIGDATDFLAVGTVLGWCLGYAVAAGAVTLVQVGQLGSLPAAGVALYIYRQTRKHTERVRQRQAVLLRRRIIVHLGQIVATMDSEGEAFINLEKTEEDINAVLTLLDQVTVLDDGDAEVLVRLTATLVKILRVTTRELRGFEALRHCRLLRNRVAEAHNQLRNPDGSDGPELRLFHVGGQ